MGTAAGVPPWGVVSCLCVWILSMESGRWPHPGGFWSQEGGSCPWWVAEGMGAGACLAVRKRLKEVSPVVEDVAQSVSAGLPRRELRVKPQHSVTG